MKYQCTSCDISSTSFNDKKFDDCKYKQHRIIPMTESIENKDTSDKSSRKIQIKKVKGMIGSLYVESVIVDNKPTFLCISNDNEISLRDLIEYDNITYKPLEELDCPYKPYTFSSSEINKLIEQGIKKEQIFDEVNELIDRFINSSEYVKILILVDLILTYCQEWTSTIHFPFFVGEKESGKSSVLHLLKWLGYRCLLSEGMSNASIYNFIGKDEEGTGTIAEDEAQDLWKNSDKIITYKNSYSKGSRKAIVIGAGTLGKHQVYYKTYCSKWFAGEKLPQDKGFLERLAIVHMVQGQPPSNIKKPSVDEVDLLTIVRNHLLFWKLQNINKKVENYKSGLTLRDQELWEDFLSISRDTKYFVHANKVVEYHVKQRHELIRDSLEAKLFKFVTDKFDQNLELNFADYWNYIVHDNPEMPGRLDEKTTKTFYPDDYSDKLTHYSVVKILDNKFHATKKDKVIRIGEKQQKITYYSFDRKIVERLITKYGIQLLITNPFYVGQHTQQGSHMLEVIQNKQDAHFQSDNNAISK